MDLVVGKDNNNSLVETLYSDITSNTIKNACEFVYKYNILNEIHNYTGSVLFWRGANESCLKKSSALFKRYILTLADVKFENMRRGQYLHEHSAE